MDLDYCLFMPRYCYCSRIIPGKHDTVRTHWASKTDDEDDSFWEALQMTGFAAWIQGDWLTHCLEGASLEGIFSGLRDQIKKWHPTALQLQSFYQQVLGKDYADPSAMPHIELLADTTLPGGPTVLKKGRCFPLLKEQVAAHRNHASQGRPWLREFGITRFSEWLQHTTGGLRLVIYTEHDSPPPQAPPQSDHWKEARNVLSRHTGLSSDALIASVEQLV